MKKLFTALALCFSTLLFSQIPTQVPTSGLISYYGFNGNSSNAVNFQHNGINHNVTLTTDRFGNTNSAYQFNGTNSYINCGMISSPSFTYSAWVLISDSFPASSCGTSYTFGVGGNIGPNNLYTVVSRLVGTNNHYNSEINIGSSGTIGTLLGDGSSWINPANNTFQNVDTGIWYHISLSYNGSQSSIYMNGTLLSRLNNSYSTDSVSPLYMGARPNFLGQISFFLNGKIDDVAIYNRALSDSEIYDLYTVTQIPTNILSNKNEIISIFPNPTKKDIRINTEEFVPSEVKIYNSLGQVVYQNKLTNTYIDIDISNLGYPGIYFVSILNSSQRINRTIVLN